MKRFLYNLNWFYNIPITEFKAWPKQWLYNTFFFSFSLGCGTILYLTLKNNCVVALSFTFFDPQRQTQKKELKAKACHKFEEACMLQKGYLFLFSFVHERTF